jgi:hypothetical protein
MYRDCRECKRLGDEYSQATQQQIALLEKSQSEIHQNGSAAQDFGVLTLAAAHRRGMAQQAISDHEAMHNQERKRA